MKSIPFHEKLATLVVDGVEKKINHAVYGGDAQLVLTDAFEVSPSEFTGRGREPYRAALVVRTGAVAENMTVRPALVGGSVTDAAMVGVKVTSETSNFNHVIVESSEYEIKDCTFWADTESDGKEVCDFNGYGALIGAFRQAKVTIDNCVLYSRGVAKPVLFADGGSNCLMRNSRYECHGGILYAGYQNTAGFVKMVAPPWVLGITGSARGTNLMGRLSTMTIHNCDCHADGWGVISTDGGREMALYVVDSTIILDKTEGTHNPFLRRYGSGYGIYAAGADEFFYGAEFNVGTYAIIGIGGEITLASSSGTVVPKQKYLVPTDRYETAPDGRKERVEEVFWQENAVFAPIQGQGRPTVIQSDGWGFMFHGNSKLNILDGTVCDTDYASILVRAVGVDICVDRSVLRPADGTILQMIDNDDKAVGGRFTPDIYDADGNLVQPHMGPLFNHEFFEHPGYPGLDYDVASAGNGQAVNLRVTNCDLCGSLYNATGYRSLGDSGCGQGEALNVALGENAAICGAITAATARHVDEFGQPNNLFTEEQYYYLGHVENVPYDNGVNAVHVKLTDNAVWTVTGESILHSLEIGPEAVVRGAGNSAVRCVVDGVEAALRPGARYSGHIVLRPAGE